MGKNNATSRIIDEIVTFSVTSAAFAAGLALPNMMIALEKPLQKFFSHMDERKRVQELRRIIYYMKEQGYLAGAYEHGLEITNKLRKRYEKIELDTLAAKPQEIWDGSWRIIIYDIPETHADARKALQAKLHEYGCFHLQKSVLITPFPCEADIATIASRFDVASYITLFESHYIVNQALLIARFRKKYPQTVFQYS